MATLSSRPAKPAPRKIRVTVKKKLTVNRPSFGAAVKKYAGIVRSGIGDLSTREGFGD